MGQDTIISRTITLLKQAIAATGHLSLLGIAVGVPGLVNQQDGALLFAPNLGWRDVLLRAILYQEFQIPIFVNNAANNTSNACIIIIIIIGGGVATVYQPVLAQPNRVSRSIIL